MTVVGEEHPGPGVGQLPGAWEPGRDTKGYVGRIHGGLGDSHSAGHIHNMPDHTSQVIKVKHLGRGRIAAAGMMGTRATNCGEPGGGNSKGGQHRTGDGVGKRMWRGLEAAEPDGRGQEVGQRPDEGVHLNGPSLPLCCGGPLDLLQALSRSVQIMSRSRLRDSTSSCATRSTCCWTSYRSSS